MCGIFGVITRPGRFDDDTLTQACAQLSRRGPDDMGVLRRVVGEWEVSFGHTRLAVVDLDPRSNQPFERGGSLLVFNGEVYNYKALRKYDVTWKTTSDTEVVAHGLFTHGPGFLAECNGMFALAWFDLAARRVILARDRLGKKPLYVWRTHDMVAFASEPKALIRLGMPTDVDPRAEAFYHLMGYVPGTLSWFAHASRVPAASFQTIELTDALPQDETLFWDPLASFSDPFEGSFDDAKSHFLELLDDATRLRLNADVPVGVFLSGGIDSSLVALSASRVSTKSVKGFTISVDSEAFDESNVALQTAQDLGIDICVVPMKPGDFDAASAILPVAYDEPLADPSQLAMLVLSQRAREEVTVVLTGDGGDEAFIGYPWISTTARFRELARICERAPAPLTWLTQQMLSSKPGKALLRSAVLLGGLNLETFDTKYHQLVDILDGAELGRLYDHFRVMTPARHLPAWQRGALPPGSMLAFAREHYPRYSWDALEERTDEEVLSALDLVTYMRDDVLVKVDRATMFASLEARSPLLDHRIVEFAASIPLRYKAHQGVHKRLLREVLEDHLPGGLSELKKQGFGVPLRYEDMPPGPTAPSRYVRQQEATWRAHWEG